MEFRVVDRINANLNINGKDQCKGKCSEYFPAKTVDCCAIAANFLGIFILQLYFSNFIFQRAFGKMARL
jgi:hypothetical protein